MAIETFVLSSTNPAKKEASAVILKSIFGETVRLECVDVESGENETPMTDEAGIRGALSRITNAEHVLPGRNGYLGLEGIVTVNSYGAFLCGWAAVSLNGVIGYGCSARVQLPDNLIENFTGFAKLSEATAIAYPDRAHLLPMIGTNGVVTNGAYTRINEFTDALHCAFSSPELSVFMHL